LWKLEWGSLWIEKVEAGWLAVQVEVDTVSARRIPDAGEPYQEKTQPDGELTEEMTVVDFDAEGDHHT
jgi:hypothetical protein